MKRVAGLLRLMAVGALLAGRGVEEIVPEHRACRAALSVFAVTPGAVALDDLMKRVATRPGRWLRGSGNDSQSEIASLVTRNTLLVRCPAREAMAREAIIAEWMVTGGETSRCQGPVRPRDSGKDGAPHRQHEGDQGLHRQSRNRIVAPT